MSNDICNGLHRRPDSGRVALLNSELFSGEFAQQEAGCYASENNANGKTAHVTYLGEDGFRVDIWGVV